MRPQSGVQQDVSDVRPFDREVGGSTLERVVIVQTGHEDVRFALVQPSFAAHTTGRVARGLGQEQKCDDSGGDRSGPIHNENPASQTTSWRVACHATHHCQPERPRFPWSLMQPAEMREPNAEESTLPKKKMDVRLVSSAQSAASTRMVVGGVPSRVYHVFKV